MRTYTRIEWFAEINVDEFGCLKFERSSKYFPEGNVLSCFMKCTDKEREKEREKANERTKEL